jgi:hypothetical protein
VRSHDEQLLTRARDLVARGWCQTGLAQDRDGRVVEPWRSCARAWSPLGALLAALYLGSDGSLDSFRIAYTCLALATGGRLEEWNAARWRTHQHVLSAFERARDFVPGVRRNLARAALERSATPAGGSSATSPPLGRRQTVELTRLSRP